MATLVSYTTMNRLTSTANPQEQTETWVMTMEFDSLRDLDISQDVYGNGLVPTYFDPHPHNPLMFVVDRSADQVEDVPQAFTITIKYSNRFMDSGQGKQGNNQFQWIQNPLQRPAIIQWDTFKTRKVFTRSLDDSDKLTVPVQTTAGEPIILEDEVSLRIIHVQKNVTRLNKIFALEMDFLNKDTIRLGSGQNIVCQPKTVWLTNLKLSPLQIENGIGYYTVSYDLIINPEGWDFKFRNMGYMEAGLFRVPIVNRLPNQMRRFTNWMRQLTRVRLPDGDLPSTPVPIISKTLIDANQFPIVGKNGGRPQVGEAVRFKDVTGKVYIPCPESDAVGSGLPEKFWNYNMLSFRTKKLLKFTGTIPLR